MSASSPVDEILCRAPGGACPSASSSDSATGLMLELSRTWRRRASPSVNPKALDLRVAMHAFTGFVWHASSTSRPARVVRDRPSDLRFRSGTTPASRLQAAPRRRPSLAPARRCSRSRAARAPLLETGAVPRGRSRPASPRSRAPRRAWRSRAQSPRPSCTGTCPPARRSFDLAACNAPAQADDELERERPSNRIRRVADVRLEALRERVQAGVRGDVLREVQGELRVNHRDVGEHVRVPHGHLAVARACTELFVTSAPGPAVVGTATNGAHRLVRGRARPTTSRKSYRSGVGPPFVSTAATHLPASSSRSRVPPPMAITAPHACSLASAIAARGGRSRAPSAVARHGVDARLPEARRERQLQLGGAREISAGASAQPSSSAAPCTPTARSSSRSTPAWRRRRRHRHRRATPRGRVSCRRHARAGRRRAS